MDLDCLSCKSILYGFLIYIYIYIYPELEINETIYIYIYIYTLEIIETKKNNNNNNIYTHTIDKYKRKMGYLQKNSPYIFAKITFTI